MWSLRVYRTALYAGELGRRDAAWLRGHAEFAHIADQMARATASISANIAEGYSRLGKKDRGKFYEYALGPAGYSGKAVKMSPSGPHFHLFPVDHAAECRAVALRAETLRAA